MPSDLDIASQRQLSELAELSLQMARRLESAMDGADGRDMARITDAFCKVSRCMRMCIALSLRITRGEAVAPARRNGAPLEADFDDDEFEPDDWEEPDEGLERESLFDRLPSGDAAAQVAHIARTLASATRGIPAAAAYRARCDAIVAGLRRDLPRHPPNEPRREPTSPSSAVAIAPNRSRGSPG
jgi:hypothetical protein